MRPLGIITASPGVIIAGAASALLVALAVLACYGIGTSTSDAAVATIILPHVMDSIRGRVFSGSGLIRRSKRLASLLPGGLADTVGIRAACYLGGALLAAAIAGLI